MLPRSSGLAVNTCLASAGSVTTTMFPNTGTLMVNASPYLAVNRPTVCLRNSP